MRATARRLNEGDVSPRLMPVVTIPVPKGLVKTRRSPGLPLAFVMIRCGETKPVTAIP